MVRHVTAQVSIRRTPCGGDGDDDNVDDNDDNDNDNDAIDAAFS